MYLTEKRLGEIFSKLLPEEEIIHDKSVPNSKNKRRRPDYRFVSKKLIVEFDGDSHYCKAKRIIDDKEKDNDYIRLGYQVVRIPYFIQMNDELLGYIFGKNHNLQFEQVYPHGFIDKKAILPADFCELGIDQFKEDLNKFHEFKNEIIKSLQDKISELGNVNLVLPSSLQYLVRT
ncbi:PDDEXK family nuclease [Endozoicomonas numazuensis]|uniref:hypothetical protein n=1 Tax=Endozoicomonas numazuensis TaxID=1137799 RepID=UPI00068C420D|nr:hypothetical protein [Endozoicomonas numazuensis]